jgi:hypothetical protein
MRPRLFSDSIEIERSDVRLKNNSTPRNEVQATPFERSLAAVEEQGNNLPRQLLSVMLTIPGFGVLID